MQMILVAGPYRSGTNDDPVLIARNVAAMTRASLQLFACLRIGGPSAGADEMVVLARKHGKTIYYSLDEIPSAAR